MFLSNVDDSVEVFNLLIQRMEVSRRVRFATGGSKNIQRCFVLTVRVNEGHSRRVNASTSTLIFHIGRYPRHFMANNGNVVYKFTNVRFLFL